MDMLISSPANPRFRQLVQLQEKSRERKKQGLFVLEGKRELSLALEAGYQVVTVYYNPEICEQAEVTSLAGKAELVSLAPVLYKKVAYREGTEGIVAVVKTREHTLAALKPAKVPLVLILEGIEKPGNLGAILRTADAAAADAVIICDPLADVYNPNCIRSSVGCVFTNQLAVCTSAEALEWCRQHELNVFVTYLEAADWYHEADYTAPSAIVMGTEATGVSDTWLQAGFPRIKIPMSGRIDSMNVSVSAAILLFEALRQRNFRVKS